MGSSSHHLALGRPFTLDDVQVEVRRRLQGKPGFGPDACACRNPRPLRRADRLPRCDGTRLGTQRGRAAGDSLDAHATIRRPAANDDDPGIKRSRSDRRLSRPGGHDHGTSWAACPPRDARPCGRDCRPGRRELSLCRPHRIHRSGNRRETDRWPRRNRPRRLSPRLYRKARQLGWTFTPHRTDHLASEALVAVHMYLSGMPGRATHGGQL
jgi:hypothetical protein